MALAAVMTKGLVFSTERGKRSGLLQRVADKNEAQWVQS